MKDRKSKIEIECETVGFDEAAEKVEALADAYDGFPAQVTVRNCRDCEINVYASQTKFTDTDTDEEGEE